MGNYQKSNNQRQPSNSQKDSPKSNKEYINGIFISRKEGQYGEFFNVGVKKEEFLKSIEAIAEDDRGFINLTMTPQKSDPSRLSVYVNDWKPTGGPTGEGGKTQVPAKPYKPSTKSAPVTNDTIDDLPF